MCFHNNIPYSSRITLNSFTPVRWTVLYYLSQTLSAAIKEFYLIIINNHYRYKLCALSIWQYRHDIRCFNDYFIYKSSLAVVSFKRTGLKRPSSTFIKLLGILFFKTWSILLTKGSVLSPTFTGDAAVNEQGPLGYWACYQKSQFILQLSAMLNTEHLLHGSFKNRCESKFQKPFIRI